MKIEITRHGTWISWQGVTLPLSSFVRGLLLGFKPQQIVDAVWAYHNHTVFGNRAVAVMPKRQLRIVAFCRKYGGGIETGFTA